MPRNCHPSAEFHPSGLTEARDTMAMQIVMDHTGDTRHQFDPADAGEGKNKDLNSFAPTAEETLFIPRLQGG